MNIKHLRLIKNEAAIEKDISMFAYKKGANFQRHQGLKKECSLKDAFQSKRYAVIEKNILQILVKYEVLNRFNIEKLLNKLCKLPVRLRKIDYSEYLQTLVEDGFVERFQLDNGNEFMKSTMIVYRASKEVYEYLNCDGYRSDTEWIADTGSILEKLSLNQWHISIVANYSEYVKEEKYKVVLGSNILDSYILLRPDTSYFRNSRIGFYAVSFSKTDERLDVFLEKVSTLHAYMKQKSKITDICFLIVTCESMQNIEFAYQAIQSYPSFKFLQVLFVLDVNTSRSNPLEWLYMCNKEEGSKFFQYRNIVLPIQKQKKDGG